MKQLVPLGALLIFVGIALLIAGSLSSTSGKSKIAVGGFIGPIPFGFGNDEGMVKFAVIMAVILLFLWLLLPRLLN